MKTTLVFFDSYTNSKSGVFRGLIAFLALVLLDVAWFNFLSVVDYSKVVSRKRINKSAAVVVWLLLASALAVQLPSSLGNSVAYSALVGLVVYGVFNGTNFAINSNWPLSLAVADTLWGVFACSVAGSLLWFVYWQK